MSYKPLASTWTSSTAANTGYLINSVDSTEVKPKKIVKKKEYIKALDIYSIQINSMHFFVAGREILDRDLYERIASWKITFTRCPLDAYGFNSAKSRHKITTGYYKSYCINMDNYYDVRKTIYKLHKKKKHNEVLAMLYHICHRYYKDYRTRGGRF